MKWSSEIKNEGKPLTAETLQQGMEAMIRASDKHDEEKLMFEREFLAAPKWYQIRFRGLYLQGRIRMDGGKAFMNAATFKELHEKLKETPIQTSAIK